MPEIKLKSLADVKAKLRDLLHRSGQRFIKQHNVPCPENCCHAGKVGTRVQPCAMCGAKPGESCKMDAQFKARYTFDELKMMYKERLENREWLLRNDRGVAMLLWVLGQLSTTEEPDPSPLPEHLLRDPQGTDPPTVQCTFNGTTLQMSPELVPLMQAFVTQLPLLTEDFLHGQTLDRRALGQEPRGADRIPGEHLPVRHPSGEVPDPGPDRP